MTSLVMTGLVMAGVPVAGRQSEAGRIGSLAFA